MKFIPQELYHKILETIPIICVDGVIKKDNKILLLKRINEPEKNKWWFPGGRLLKNELLEEAIVRKMKEEISFEVKILKYIDVTQTIFSTGPNNIPVHTVNFTYLLDNINGKLDIDKNHSDYAWFDSPPHDMHVEGKRIFKLLY